MKHQWVKIVITPVHIVSDPEISSEPVILITDDDQIEAEECAQYGCNRCDEALNSDNVHNDCIPEDEEFDQILRESSFGEGEEKP